MNLTSLFEKIAGKQKQRERLADLQRRHTESHDRSFKLRQTINDCRTWAISDRAEAAHTSLSHKEQELRERAERAKRRLPSARRSWPRC